MKNFKQKLKMIIIDNLLVMILSFVMYLGCAYILGAGILPQLKPLWFILFFIAFGVFMYNICAIIKVDHLKRHIINDFKDISDGKIDGKQNGNPL